MIGTTAIIALAVLALVPLVRALTSYLRPRHRMKLDLKLGRQYSLEVSKALEQHLKDVIIKGDIKQLIKEEPLFSPSEEAYINLNFEDDDDHQKLDIGSGLTVGHVYRLQIGLGSEIDPLQKGPPAPALRKETGDTVSMRVAVLPRTPGIRFINNIAQLEWGPGSRISPAEFVLEALTPGPALFDVYIDRDCDLLFVAAVEAEIGYPGATEWSRPDPIGWVDVTRASIRRRSRAFRRFARLQQVSLTARSICIAIQKMATSDEYLLTVLPAGKDIELPMRARFSRLMARLCPVLSRANAGAADSSGPRTRRT